MKVLIFATSICRNPFEAKTINYWIRLIERTPYNWLIVDSGSPRDQLAQVTQASHIPFEKQDTDELFDYKIVRRESYVGFKTNVGHPNDSIHSGSHRAIQQGIKIAIDNEYDYAVFVENDLLCNLNIAAICRDMDKKKLKVVSCRSKHYNWLESGLIFMNLKFVQDINLIGKLPWRDNGYQKVPLPKTEHLLEQIFGMKNIDFRPWRGDRIEDRHPLTTEGMHYITHFNEKERQEFFKWAMATGFTREVDDELRTSTTCS